MIESKKDIGLVDEAMLSGAKAEHKLAKEALESHPLYQNDTNERRIAANTLGKSIGMSDTQIADLNKQLQDMPEILGIEPEDDALKIAKKISAKMQESGENIGKAMKKLDEIIPEDLRKLIIQSSFSGAEQQMEDILEKYVGEQRKQAERTLKPFLNQIETERRLATLGRWNGTEWVDRRPLTFSENTQSIKKWAREQVNFNKDNDFVNNLRKQASSIISNSCTEAEDGAINFAEQKI